MRSPGAQAYQPLVHSRAAAGSLLGHHGGRSRNHLSGRRKPNGTSILDVTDTKAPRYLAHVPGEQGERRGGR